MTLNRFRSLFVVFLFVLPWAGCDDENPSVDSGVVDSGVDLSKPIGVDISKPFPAQLSSLNLFTWSQASGFTFHEGIVPYELNTALFSDYALKSRALYVPPGQHATYEPSQSFPMPTGSFIIKTFYFPADFRHPEQNQTLIETRLLVRYADSWQPYTYIWNAEQTDAVLSPAGETKEITFIDGLGVSQTANYLVPQRNQCASCHDRKPDMASAPAVTLIGVKARYLDRDNDYGANGGVVNQLTHLANVGYLEGLPPLDTITPAYDFRPVEVGGVAVVPPADLNKAARDYLDINCAHCHSPNGVQGITSQLFLNYDNEDPFHLGICKRPGSAGAGTGGYTFDILPGNAEQSILDFRTRTVEVGAMMPLIGRSLRHRQGVEVVSAWIDAMPANNCAGQ